jgi:hypothetical protein
MDSHKGSLLLSGHHGSALRLSRALNASNSVLHLHCFLKRTDFFHTRTTDEKPISIITILEDRRIGVQFPAAAEYVCSPGDHNRRGAHLASRGAHLASYAVDIGSSSFPSLKRPSGEGGEPTTRLHPPPSLRMCGPTPLLPNIRYYTAVSLAQTTSHFVA